MPPRPEGQLAPTQVVLWPDTWNNYYHPQTLAAAEKVLSWQAFEFKSPKAHLLRPRALRFRSARPGPRLPGQSFRPHGCEIDAGLRSSSSNPVAPASSGTRRLEVVSKRPTAQRMSKQVWLLADWLAAKAPEWAPGRLQDKQIILHGHCHHKAIFADLQTRLPCSRRPAQRLS